MSEMSFEEYVETVGYICEDSFVSGYDLPEENMDEAAEVIETAWKAGKTPHEAAALVERFYVKK